MKSIYRSALLIALIGQSFFTSMAVAGATQADIAHANGSQIERLSKAERAEIERMLDQVLADAASKLTLIDGQTGFDIRTKLLPKQYAVVIEMGTRAIPSHTGSELEDQQDVLSVIVRETLRDQISIDVVEFRYGGRNIFDIMPDGISAIQPARRTKISSNSTSAIVSIAGGHGLYFNYQYNDWRAQRDPVNGVTEDFVTPYFARDLAALLSGQGFTVKKARTNDSTIHLPSGEQWWKVGSRYYLQSTLPSQTEVWHSLPNATHSLRERDEDIRSRPLYANYVGADYVVSLHTNADVNVSTRGTRAYIQTGRTGADHKLAANILCRMKQTIHSARGYEFWDVSDTPYQADKGESRLAVMPAVIIELGFHTSFQDALALEDSNFRDAAVRGVERGISDYHAGLDCKDFMIASIPYFSAATGSPMEMLVHFDGNPRFPVTLHTRNITCSEGWSCSSGTLTYSAKQESPIKRTFNCTGASNMAGTFRYAAWLVDASGIKTPEVEYTYSCTASG